MIYKIYNLGLFSLITVVIASYFGKYFWICEMLSNFKLYYILASIIFLIFAIIFKNKILVLLLIGGLAIQAFTIYQSYSKLPSISNKTDIEEELTLLQYNTHYLNENYVQIVDYLNLNQEKIDVIFLQEVAPKLKAELKRIEKYYPYHITMDDRWFGRAFYSKIPILSHEIKFFDKSSNDNQTSKHKTKDQYFGTNIHYLIAHLETKKHSIPIAFYGIHTTYPFVENAIVRNNELKIVAEEINKDVSSTHKILAGDFNTTPFSYWFKLLEKTTGLLSAERGTGINNTWPSWLKFNLLRISIDHALVSDNIEVQERIIGDDLGSDHLPVILKLKILK